MAFLLRNIKRNRTSKLLVVSYQTSSGSILKEKRKKGNLESFSYYLIGVVKKVMMRPLRGLERAMIREIRALDIYRLAGSSATLNMGKCFNGKWAFRVNHRLQLLLLYERFEFL